jgi:hypothetical protein
MNARKLLAAMVIWGGCFAKVGYAEILPPSLTNSSYWPQFYASLTAGVQRMSGPRSEYVNYQASPGNRYGAPALISLSNLQQFSNKNATGSAHMGCTWDVPRTAFFIGSEIYIGQSGVKNTHINSFVDIDSLVRSLNATIRQSTYFGGALQVGFNWFGKARLSFLLGLESGQFEYFGMYVPRSQNALKGVIDPAGPGPGFDFPPTLINSSKWLSGLMLGFGIEKQIQSFRIGADLRMVQYRVFRVSTQALASEPETLFTAIKPKNIRFGLKISYVF